MPNRILREGVLDSDAIVKLSARGETTFFRLVLVADDFGRFDGRVSVIRSRCYPIHRDVTNEALAGWLRECCEAGLVITYVVDGKPYLEIQKFKQRTRAQKSKFPSLEQAGGELTDIWPSNDRHSAVGASPLSPPTPSPNTASDSVRRGQAADSHLPGNGQTHARQKVPRGTRMALESLPEDWRSFCVAERQDLDPGAVFERFRDHWAAVPGQRGVKLDWAATWRNWVRSERAGAPRKMTDEEVVAAAAAQIPD